MEQHTKSEAHRLVCGLRRKLGDVPSVPQPLACPEIMRQAKAGDQALPASSTVADDAALLNGNVPSPAEWKDAWAELSEVCSLVKIGRMTEKKAGSGGQTLFESAVRCCSHTWSSDARLRRWG